jgi:hypothetical protein
MAFTQNRVNDGSVNRLIKLYKDSASRLLSNFGSVSDFSRSRRLALIAEVDKELNKLGKDTQSWLDTELRKSYGIGMKDAVAGLNTLVVEGAIGKDKVPIKGNFTQPNKLQVQALIDDSSRAFGEALTLVGRNVRSITTQAFQREIRAKIAEGVVTGQTRKDIVSAVKNELQNNGLIALRDRGGKSWSLDRYADMLARTKLTEARNTGLSTKMLENGHDLVQVSINGSDHKACADQEGKIFSLTGKTAGYPPLSVAENEGLFHPNCKHTINPIEVKLAEKTYGWDRETGEYKQGVFENA